MITRAPGRLGSAVRSRQFTRTARCTTLLDLYRSRFEFGRNNSTQSQQPEPVESPTHANLRSQFSNGTSSPSRSPSQSRPKRSLRPYIYATAFLLLGLTVGNYMRLVVAPPPLPLPDTKEDEYMVEFLRKQAENLPLVKSLTGDPAWTHYDAYGGIPLDERAKRLTTGPLAGARALGGFQRIFIHSESGECVSVVWFGGAIAGWPGVTHGGLIATVMDESLGRCALSQFAERNGVTANLELNYLAPVVSNSFVVIRAIPQKDGSTDKKQWVSGRLENVQGKVCVEAKALFVVPKNLKL